MNSLDTTLTCKEQEILIRKNEHRQRINNTKEICTDSTPYTVASWKHNIQWIIVDIILEATLQIKVPLR